MEYTRFAFSKETEEVYFLRWPWKDSKPHMQMGMDKDGVYYGLNSLKLIRIPLNFKAYIKEDSEYHGLKGEWVNLKTHLEEAYESFRNKSSNGNCLYFESAEGFFIPNGDVDFTTIQPIEETIVPPMPSLKELEKCLIEFEGRKTIITYCNGFVSEAVCHPEDDFKVETGIAIAYSRAKKAKDKHDAILEEQKKIKVGDIVRVIDAGKNYATAIKKVIEICTKIEALHLCTKYVYNEMLMNSEDKLDLFDVLGIDGHFVYIQNKTNQKCRLIGMKGINKIASPKTRLIDDI